MKRILIFLVSITVILLLSACGGSSGSSSATPVVVDTTIDDIADFDKKLLWSSQGDAETLTGTGDDSKNYTLAYGGGVPKDTTGLTLDGDIKTLEDELAPIAEDFLRNLGTIINAGGGVYISYEEYKGNIGYRSLLFSLIGDVVDIGLDTYSYKYRVSFGKNEFIMISYSYLKNGTPSTLGTTKVGHIIDILGTENGMILRPLDEPGNAMLVLLGFPELLFTQEIPASELDKSIAELRGMYNNKFIFYEEGTLQVYDMKSSLNNEVLSFELSKRSP